MMQVARQNHLFPALILLVLITIAAGIMWKSDTNDWFMETSGDAGLVLADLTISGLERTAENDFLAVLDVDSGMPLLSIDLGHLQAKIEALPWIKQADVSRILPGELSIRVTERTPYALAQHDGRIALIDPAGVEITQRGLSAFTDLMLVVGKVEPAELELLERQKAKAAPLSSRIRSAVRVGNRRWDVIFDNGIRVKLPADDAKPYGMAEAWDKFVELDRTKQLLAREVSVIDLRLEDQLIVRVTPVGRRQMAGKEWIL